MINASNTYLSVLQRWGLDVNSEDLLVEKDSLETISISKEEVPENEACLHVNPQTIDFASKQIYCDELTLDVAHFCVNQHYQHLGSKGPKADRALKLLFLAQGFRALELDAYREVAALVQDKYLLLTLEQKDLDVVSGSRALLVYFFSDLMDSLRYTAIQLGLALDNEKSAQEEKIWDSFLPSLQAKAREDLNLPVLDKSEPSAYFEIGFDSLETLNLLERIYPRIPSQAGYYYSDSHVFEMPLSFLKSQKKARRVAAGHSIKTFQPCWVRNKDFTKPRSPWVAAVHPKLGSTPEFEETLRVLAKEMIFTEASKAAQALCESI